MEWIRLFCIPYAGGSANIFNKWRPYLDQRIRLYPVELAGRGQRVHDPCYPSIKEGLQDIFQQIKNDLTTAPYALFGHSMGAIYAYELTRKIKSENCPQPWHVFFSGRGAPHIPFANNGKIFYQMPEEEFKKEVLNLGGTPEEVFEYPELLDILLPVLRNDFKLTETYEFEGEVEPIDCDITVLAGKSEKIAAEQMFAWKEYTRYVCGLFYFCGDHFFINSETQRIVKMINHILIDQVNSRCSF